MVASNASQVALVALLVLVMGLALAMVPAMMFPILKRQNEALAIGYVIFRGALETFTYIALAMCWLLLVVVARQYADSGAAVASQFSSLGILLVKARDPITCSPGHRLQPRRPDVLLPVVSSETHSAMAIRLGDCCGHAVFGRGPDRHVQARTLVILLMPLALQEMVMAIWLIVKGFNPSAIASLSAKTDAI